MSTGIRPEQLEDQTIKLTLSYWTGTGVARELGARAPLGRRKKLGPNLQGKVVSAPEAKQISIFLGNWEIWTVGVVNLAVLACVLRATTKKGRKLFGEKVHPKRKSWLRLICGRDGRFAVALRRRYVFWSSGRVLYTICLVNRNDAIGRSNPADWMVAKLMAHVFRPNQVTPLRASDASANMITFCASVNLTESRSASLVVRRWWPLVTVKCKLAEKTCPGRERLPRMALRSVLTH